MKESVIAQYLATPLLFWMTWQLTAPELVNNNDPWYDLLIPDKSEQSATPTPLFNDVLAEHGWLYGRDEWVKRA